MITNTVVGGIHRIPALTWLDGTGLIALFDARLTVDDLPAPIDLVCSTSTDGRSWTPPRPAITATGHRGVGDASLMTTVGGELLAFHAASDLAGFFESRDLNRAGIAEASDVTHVHVARGQMSGKMRGELGWTSQSITDVIAEPGTDAAFASSGTGIRLKSGRLLQSIVVRAGAEIFLRVLRSDDDGHSWLSADVAGVGNEATIAELPDGTVILHSRGVGHRLASYSHDGGVTFSTLETVEELVDPGCNGHLLFWNAAGVLATTHLADPHLRRHLVVDISMDFGETWTHRITIEKAEAAYSTAVEMPNGELAILWEAGGCRSLKCTVVSADDIEERVPAPLEAVASLRHVVRDIEGAGIEVAMPDPGQWGEGVFKIVSDPTASTQVIRTRDDKIPAHSDSLEIGDELVFDVRHADGSVDYGITVPFDGRSISEVSQTVL